MQNRSNPCSSFGMLMPNRAIDTEKYRFGFNDKENDNELKGIGNQQDYGMREYDTRLNRFMSIDPLGNKFPYYSPYNYAANKPICSIDLDGLENIYYSIEFTQSSVMKILTESGIHQELVKAFQNTQATEENPNVNIGWDLLIIKGETKNYTTGGNTTFIPRNQIDDQPLLNGYKNIAQTIKDDPSKKGIIVIVIRQENVTNADGNASLNAPNWKPAANSASDTDHEIECHALNIAYGSSLPQDIEHENYYSQDDKRYIPEKPGESPSKEEARTKYPKSRGGQTAQEHFDIAKKFESDGKRQ